MKFFRRNENAQKHAKASSHGYRANVFATLPHFIVVAWLVFLGLVVWNQALSSVQPPLYDPLSYLQKAKNFWDAVDKGILFNPLNIEPVVRPPGTILMSYPFGFQSDYRGFHFRSVFLPIVFMAVAVYVAAGSTITQLGSWKVASTAMLLTSLPMFYHLDLTEISSSPVRWGLVDNFQAATAAVATACAVRSFDKKSLIWVNGAWLISAFTLFIKPSGLMIMALLGSIWLVIGLIEWRARIRQGAETFSTRSYILQGGMSALLVYGIVIFICLSSKYLSEQTFQYAQLALLVMKNELAVSFNELFWLFHMSAGIPVVLWTFATIAIAILALIGSRQASIENELRLRALIVCSLIVWLLGAWYWLVVQAGANQIRYFYPFMLMGVVLLTPVALQGWDRASNWTSGCLLIISIAPAINLAALLLNGQSENWERTIGVNVSVGRGKETVAQARDLLQNIKSHNVKANLYSFSAGVPSAVFENTLMLEETLRPEEPAINILRPLDWTRGFAVRQNELVDSEFILIQRIDKDRIQRLLGMQEVKNFNDESAIVQAWLLGHDTNTGLELVSESKELLLLRVFDKKSFQESLEKFISARSWRREFVMANLPIWWNSSAIKTHDKDFDLSNINFGGVYQLKGLRIDSNDKRLKLEVWWKEVNHERRHAKYKMFLHLIDDAGNILHNNEISLSPYDPPDAVRVWRYDSVEVTSAFAEKKISALAFGVFDPETNSFLLADSRVKSDWNGRRILVPITKK